MNENDAKLKEAIRRETLRIEEDCTFSSKSHFNASSMWAKIHLLIGAITTILAASTSGAAFWINSAPTAGILGLLVAGFSAVWTFLDPNEKSSSHRKAGDNYLTLRNNTRMFRELDLDGADLGFLQAKIKEFNDIRNGLNEGSPSIPKTAFLQARTGIEEGEADHSSDRNIMEGP